MRSGPLADRTRAPAPKVYALGTRSRTERVHLLRRSTRPGPLADRTRAPTPKVYALGTARGPNACTCSEGQRARDRSRTERVHLLRRSTRSGPLAHRTRTPAPKVYALGTRSRTQHVHLLRRSTRSGRGAEPNACTCSEGPRARDAEPNPARTPARKAYALGTRSRTQPVHLLRRSTRSGPLADPTRSPAPKVYALGTARLPNAYTCSASNRPTVRPARSEHSCGFQNKSSSDPQES